MTTLPPMSPPPPPQGGFNPPGLIPPSNTFVGSLRPEELAPDLVTPARHELVRFQFTNRRAVMISTDARLAFHEAGHAMASWLMGDACQLHSIDMRPDSWSSACVRYSLPSPLWDLFEDYPRRSPDLPAATTNAMLREGSRRILRLLMGSAAANAAWLDRPGWFHEQALQLNRRRDPTDFYKVWQTALTIQPSWPRACRLLLRLSRLTDELVRHPRVWGCIFALAVAQNKGAVMMQQEICTILERAWGHPATWPAVELGPRWRRILIPSIVQDCECEPDPPRVYKRDDMFRAPRPLVFLPSSISTSSGGSIKQFRDVIKVAGAKPPPGSSSG